MAAYGDEDKPQTSSARYVRSAIELRFTKKLDSSTFVDVESFHSPIVRRDVMDRDEVVSLEA